MMDETKSSRQRGILGAVLVLVLGGGVFCMTRQADVPPPNGGGPVGPGLPPGTAPEQLAPDCLASLQIQQDLARLALDAMRTYGRIDPGLYDTTPAPDGQALIRVSRDAKPLQPSEGPVLLEGRTPAPIPVERFNETLRRINADPAAKVFQRAHEAARQKCGELCPPTVYPIKVTAVDQGKESEAYTFAVEGERLPTLPEWQQGFLGQYASLKSQCAFVPPIKLDELEQKHAGLSGGDLSPDDKAARAVARKMLGTGEASKASKIRGGRSELRLRCDDVSFSDECHGCMTAQNNNGGYKMTLFGNCCYASCP